MTNETSVTAEGKAAETDSVKATEKISGSGKNPLEAVCDLFSKKECTKFWTRWLIWIKCKIKLVDSETVYWKLKSYGSLKSEYACEWYRVRKNSYQLWRLAREWKLAELFIFEDDSPKQIPIVSEEQPKDPFEDFFAALGKCVESCSGIEGSTRMVTELAKLSAEKDLKDRLTQLHEDLSIIKDILNVLNDQVKTKRT